MVGKPKNPKSFVELKINLEYCRLRNSVTVGQTVPKPPVRPPRCLWLDRHIPTGLTVALLSVRPSGPKKRR